MALKCSCKLEGIKKTDCSVTTRWSHFIIKDNEVWSNGNVVGIVIEQKPNAITIELVNGETEAYLVI